jgi:hypothetical protein
VVLTHDLDYGRLLAFSGAFKPSVVIIRLSRPTPRNIFERLMAVWVMIERPLMEGAVVALEDATIRIRRLLIRHDKQSGDRELCKPSFSKDMPSLKTFSPQKRA